MRIRLYLDEDVPASFAQALRNRGVDVLTTQEAGNTGLSDLGQLSYAAKEQRAIFTHNKRDFAMLYKQYLQNQKEHSGVILSDQQPTGLLLRRFMKLWCSLTSVAMKNRLEFLGSYT